MLINGGRDVVEVSRRAGYSNVGTTLNIYSHVFQKLDRGCADVFEKAVYKK